MLDGKDNPNANDVNMIKLAIRAEEHLALLLTQLHSYVSRPQGAYIARVVKEEWGHKEKLEDIMKEHFAR